MVGGWGVRPMLPVDVDNLQPRFWVVTGDLLMRSRNF